MRRSTNEPIVVQDLLELCVDLTDMHEQIRQALPQPGSGDLRPLVGLGVGVR